MSSVTTRGKSKKNACEKTKKTTKETSIECNTCGDGEGIESLQKEILKLRKVLDDQEETIDDLVQERDEALSELFKARITLADIWNIKHKCNSTKIREVCRRIENKDAINSKNPAAANQQTQTYASITREESIETDTEIIVHKITETLKTQLQEVFDAKLKPAEEKKLDLTSIKTIIREDRQEQHILQRERKKRSCNAIVHGISEEDSTTNDKAVIQQLFETMSVKLTPESITRLGTAKRGSTRPIKLVMKNENEKNVMMKALPRLQQATGVLRNVSVTNDYTIAERNEITRWVAMARAKTANENEGIVWKVRGIPFSNIRLVKIQAQEERTKKYARGFEEA